MALKMVEDHGSIPTKEEVSIYVKKTLDEGSVVQVWACCIKKD